MATLKSFKRNLSWTDLGSLRIGVDYDDSYSESRRIKKSDKKAVLVHDWLIRGLELVYYTGHFYSAWDDGTLTDIKYFPLNDLEPFPDYEYSEVPWTFAKQRVSAVWFHSRRQSLSRFFKTVPSEEYDDWVDNHPDAPRFIIFPNDTAKQMTDWYLERGQVETLRSLRIPVPFVNRYKVSDFDRFIRLLGNRILMARDYYASLDALSFLPCDLSERYASILE